MAQNIHLFKIDVAFATQDRQLIIHVEVAPNTSVIDVIHLSKIQEYFPEFDLLNMPLGIFGKKIDPNTYEIKDNDRIEIYRPLYKTPNQRRLERAKIHEN